MQRILKISNSTKNYLFPVIITETNYMFNDVFFISQRENCDYYITSKLEDNMYKQTNISLYNNIFPIDIPMTKVNEVNLLFPLNIDKSIGNYICNIFMYIGFRKLHLGCFLINSNLTTAISKPLRINNINYYEGIKFYIPNPFEILYSDNWKQFRERLCGEIGNNAETQLIVELSPCEESIYESNNCFISKQDYVGGYTNFSVTNNIDESLKLNIDFTENYSIITNLEFNKIYNTNFELYMQETYYINNIFDYDVFFELIIKDTDNIYKYHTSKINSNEDIKQSFDNSLFNFNWNDYQDGFEILSSLIIRDENENELLTIMSNTLPFTKEAFAYFISNNSKINLNNVDMKIYNLDIVNKIEKKIYKMNNPPEDKSKAIHNVFIFSSSMDDLILYKNVKQNVLLPLNGYKTKVNLFYLSIEGELFVEVGRSSQGVIFSVNSQKIIDVKEYGNFFVLNEDKELVSVGKYTYK